jgi:hypothetical protein
MVNRAFGIPQYMTAPIATRLPAPVRADFHRDIPQAIRGGLESIAAELITGRPFALPGDTSVAVALPAPVAGRGTLVPGAAAA